MRSLKYIKSGLLPISVSLSPVHSLEGFPYYLLTEFAFRTVRYEDQGPEVRTELARSVRKNRGLNILQYEKQTRLINSLSDAREVREGQTSLKGFCDLGLKLESCWVTHRQEDVDKFFHL